MSDESNAGTEAPPADTGVSDIADDLVNDQPAPTPGAAEQSASEFARSNEPTDKHGNTFDPEIHQSNPDGTPKLTSKKKLAIKPGKRSTPQPSARPAARSVVPPIHAGGGVLGQAPTAVPDPGPDYRLVATLTVDNELAVMAIGLGSGWKADQGEREALIDAWEAYYREKGVTEVSPLAMLALVHSGYAAKRIMAPDDETKTRFQAVKLWGANLVHKVRKRNRGAQSDRGNDGEREDNAGEEAGAGVSS